MPTRQVKRALTGAPRQVKHAVTSAIYSASNPAVISCSCQFTCCRCCVLFWSLLVYYCSIYVYIYNHFTEFLIFFYRRPPVLRTDGLVGTGLMPYKAHSLKYRHFMLFPVPVYSKYHDVMSLLVLGWRFVVCLYVAVCNALRQNWQWMCVGDITSWWVW